MKVRIPMFFRSVLPDIAAYLLAFYIYLMFFMVLGWEFEEFYFRFDLQVLARFSLIGVFVGLSAGSGVRICEPWLRERSFPVTLLLLTVCHVFFSFTALFLFVLLEAWLSMPAATVVASIAPRFHIFLHSEFIVLLFYLPIVTLFLNYSRLLVRRIGLVNFRNAVTGRYHHPHEEVRVFMFLDMDGSTAIAEELGHVRYHELLHFLFNRLSLEVARHEGEIYQYVGDGIVVTWPIDSGARRMQALECYFSMCRIVQGLEGELLGLYGVSPHFKAGIHAGKVTAGEVGVDKREVVFHGDTVNTSSRIEEICSDMGEELLFSDELRALFPAGLLHRYRITYMGSITLNGRHKPTRLYTAEQA